MIIVNLPFDQGYTIENEHEIQFRMRITTNSQRLERQFTDPLLMVKWSALIWCG